MPLTLALQLVHLDVGDTLQLVVDTYSITSDGGIGHLTFCVTLQGFDY